MIGGSVGLAARAQGARTVGWDPDPAARAAAAARGAADPRESLAEVAAGADVVFVAAPVGALPETVGAALAAAGPDTVVTDVGSTKRAVVAEHGEDPRFVGGHPLAGAETAGIAHARADLFAGATWYLTPTPTTAGLLFERLHRLVGALGARPAAIDADTHDRTLAAVSHLPHVFANILVAQAARVLDDPDSLPATGPSFRDATRVAGANSAIWTDIYLSNADTLADRLDDAIARLSEFRATLARRDAAGVTAWNDAARADRRRLLDAQLPGGEACELRVPVPNRPGVVAEIALELGRAGVNISDMALYPAADMSEGVVALWVAGAEAADRAAALIESLGHPVARA